MLICVCSLLFASFFSLFFLWYCQSVVLLFMHLGCDADGRDRMKKKKKKRAGGMRWR